MRESQAITRFEAGCESVASLCRCADIYALNALAAMRDQEPNHELARKIISEKGVSHLAHSWQLFMSNEEREAFGKNAHLRAICEHITFSSYVVIEDFLKSKFREYFRHKFSAKDQSKIDILVNEISLRDLSEINKQFRKYFGARISSFHHPDVTIYAEAKWFQPKDSWSGLKRLEACRHEVAHEGTLRSAELVVLVDAWSAFQFVRRYGHMFESCYNSFIYRGEKVRFEAKT